MSKNTDQNKNRDDMVPNRWRYLKQDNLMWRFRHVSAYARMVPHDPPKVDATGKPALKPWVERPGSTLVCDRLLRHRFARHETGIPRLPKDLVPGSAFTVPQLTKLSTGISYGLRR